MDKIYNGLQSFFAKRYTPTVASDYFDKNLNFLNLTDV